MHDNVSCLDKIPSPSGQLISDRMTHSRSVFPALAISDSSRARWM